MATQTENGIYFTVIPSKAGFTDQLFQFNTFYKFGLSLGYTYLHSEFTNTRPGAEDIYDFLGFNAYFDDRKLTDKTALYRRMGVNNRLGDETKYWRNRVKNKIKFHILRQMFFTGFNFVDIGLGQTLTLEPHADPVESLRNTVRSLVAKMCRAGSGRKNVVRFNLTGGRSFFGELAPLINQQIPFFPDDLDLRASYFLRRKDNPVTSRFGSGRLKVLVHIRLGDTALIATPWHTFIPLWSDLCISPLKEYPDKRDPLFLQVMDEADFAPFLHKFSSIFGTDDASFAIFSDGYKTAFKELFRNISDLHLDRNRTDALKASVASYEASRFSIFDDIQKSVRLVGESNLDLQELVHCSLTANIIIVGCQQRMIPKFLATYYDTSLENPPVIIALYRGRVPRYQAKIGLDERKARIYPVNINCLENNPELDIAVEAIRRQFLLAAGGEPLRGTV